MSSYKFTHLISNEQFDASTILNDYHYLKLFGRGVSHGTMRDYYVGRYCSDVEICHNHIVVMIGEGVRLFNLSCGGSNIGIAYTSAVGMMAVRIYGERFDYIEDLNTESTIAEIWRLYNEFMTPLLLQITRTFTPKAGG